MSDVPVEQVTVPAAAPENGVTSTPAVDFWQVLGALVPEGTTQTITDDEGTEYQIPLEIAGRRQIGVFRELRAIQKEVGVEVEQLRALVTGGSVIQGIVGAVDLVGDDRIVTRINAAMRHAFGDNGKGRGALREALTEVEALDLFSLQACVQALLPFGISPLLQLGGAVRLVTGGATVTTSKQTKPT